MAIMNERQRLIIVPEHGNISHLHKLCHFLHTLQCMYSKKIQQCCYKQPIGHSCAHLWYIRRYLNERRKELGVKKIFFLMLKTPLVIKIKCTCPMTKIFRLKQTSLVMIVIQTSEFPPVLFVVVIGEMWKRERKKLSK